LTTGIGSGATAADQEAATSSLLNLWREVESLIERGQLEGAGLCDLHPPIFMALYEEANIKPTSVQVSLPHTGIYHLFSYRLT
jgi:diketogulonate reductase-like aldo/keto reductase